MQLEANAALTIWANDLCCVVVRDSFCQIDKLFPFDQYPNHHSMRQDPETLLQNNFARSAGSYDEAAFLARETGLRMGERLDYVKIAPHRVADIGCATGDGALALQKRYRNSQVVAIDYALPMLRVLQARTPRVLRLLGRGPRLIGADVNALPVEGNSIGLVWSNLMFHWLTDPLPAFKEIHRALEIGGLLMFAALGPDTLKELRAAGQKVGAGETARRFLDMHDLGDMLLAAGFTDPVMDMELIRVDYRSPRRFLADQRHLGVRDTLLGNLPWQTWRRLFDAATDAEGGLPMSYEIVFGHAWKAAPRTTNDGRTPVIFHRR
jgi:malonyl-CoA O-methyltransferase